MQKLQNIDKFLFASANAVCKFASMRLAVRQRKLRHHNKKLCALSAKENSASSVIFPYFQPPFGFKILLETKNPVPVTFVERPSKTLGVCKNLLALIKCIDDPIAKRLSP